MLLMHLNIVPSPITKFGTAVHCILKSERKIFVFFQKENLFKIFKSWMESFISINWVSGGFCNWFEDHALLFQTQGNVPCLLSMISFYLLGFWSRK